MLLFRNNLTTKFVELH